ncbi:MAG: beta-ketoacyl synthase N-terminal-like domain-containing protein [Flavihumibacter sp.]
MPDIPVFITASSVVTPMGRDAAAVLDAIAAGRSGVKVQGFAGSRVQTVCAALFDAAQQQSLLKPGYSFFESLLLAAVAAMPAIDFSDPRTLLVIASTKGNIGLLTGSTEDPHAVSDLVASARKLAAAVGYPRQPVLVSNACISGMSALLYAKRLLQSGAYNQAVVVAADCLSPFIVAGFQSFQALSAEVCKPFDQHRDGLNLGEGAAAMLLTKTGGDLVLSGGASSSDANHISGPSRTGDEMAMAIKWALQAAGIEPRDIGFVCAHGTATPYNDEMESKAIHTAGINQSPVFSLKPYFGHTLGAAGLLESVIAIEAMRRNWLIASAGYLEHGVSVPLPIAGKTGQYRNIDHILKTGSGFGGCNAALVFSKHKQNNIA